MNVIAHFDSDSWLVYADVRLSPGERQSMQDHANACLPCAARRRSAVELVSALSDSRTWTDSESAASSENRLFERVRLAARNHERDRHRAETSIASLRELPEDDLVRELTDLEVPTSAFVLELASHARATLERDPQRACFLAELAVKVSRRLADSPASLHARGVALKEKGNALRFLGLLREALEAYDDSRECFMASPAGGFDAAQVDLGRAMVLLETGELGEASELARQSSRIFLEFGDAKRWLHAQLLSGAIAFSLGKIAEAKDIFLELLRPAREQRDLETLSRLFNNLGPCYVELGDSDAAATYLLQAIATYRELGMKTEEIRTRWSLGRMLLHAGKPGDAAARLGDVAAEFASCGMLLESALASLDRIDALLVLGLADEVPLLVEKVLATCRRAGAQPPAVTALSYLHEATRAGKVSQEKVRHVRSFLERLPEEPNLLFLPIPE